MSDRANKVLLTVELILFLVPATAVIGVIVWLSYPAYPPSEVRPLNVVFDLCMIAVLVGLVSAWRLTIGYLIGGRSALGRTSAAWSVCLALGALAAFAGAIAAGEHMSNPDRARDFVGYALLSPALPLVIVAAHLFWLRRRARSSP